MPKDRHWLVGVSGGADSVALLHLLVENEFQNLVICHLNHQLRGEAAEEDAAFVGRLASDLELPLELGLADVRKSMQESGKSMETAARQARQEFFARCAKLHGSHHVILAHHADDQAETVLWNLLRGSHGLRGMQSVREIGDLIFHRPLLEIRRAEIRRYLESNRLSWREDASNAEPIAIRNRLRNEVLPLLAEISNRNPVHALTQLQADWSEMQEFADDSLKSYRPLDPQDRLHLPALRAMPSLLQRRAVANFLRSQGIKLSRKLIDAVLQVTSTEGPSVVNLPGEKRFRRRAGRGFIE